MDIKNIHEHTDLPALSYMLFGRRACIDHHTVGRRNHKLFICGRSPLRISEKVDSKQQE